MNERLNEPEVSGQSNHRAAGCIPGVLVRLARAFTPTGPPAEFALPYRRKDYLLTRGERVFYHTLGHCLDADRHRIFAKVRLLDLVWLPKGTTQRQSHRNRVQSKHVDFVICSADALRPLLVIELDDRSHDRADRQERDAFVDAALRSAGLPLLRMKAAANHDRNALAAQIGPHLQ
jgi:hypothetical protein